jgi:putative membrane protein
MVRSPRDDQPEESMMARALLHFIVIVATFLLLAHVVPGFYVSGWGAAVLAALVLGLVNAILRPILMLLSLPLLLITLGLFWFVLNALLLIFVAFIVPGFSFNGFMPALIGSVVLAAVNLIWGMVARAGRDDD